VFFFFFLLIWISLLRSYYHTKKEKKKVKVQVDRGGGAGWRNEPAHGRKLEGKYKYQDGLKGLGWVVWSGLVGRGTFDLMLDMGHGLGLVWPGHGRRGGWARNGSRPKNQLDETGSHSDGPAHFVSFASAGKMKGKIQAKWKCPRQMRVMRGNVPSIHPSIRPSRLRAAKP